MAGFRTAAGCQPAIQPITNRRCLAGAGGFLKFVSHPFEEPTIFWAFNSQEELPKHAIITQKTSEGGDLCHHKITGLSIKEAKKIIYAVPIDKCSICDGGHMRQLTSEDLTS